ncbi:retropepsin-like aspartic protease family protein [Kaarinaea lacus]
MSTDHDQFEQSQSRRLGVWMVAAMWIVLLWLLTIFFSRWSEHEYNPNQNVANVVAEGGVREVVLQRNRKGHYVTSGFINDKPVTFILDTGATDISIPAGLADELGLKRGATIYFQTANGPAAGYTTVLDSVAIGHIELHNVRASINPNVKDLDILLGMTFLKHLEFAQQGNTLTLRQYPVSQ